MSEGTATLEPPAANSSAPSSAAPAVDGHAAPGCPNCGNLEPWGRSSWCPECGFYPRLGTAVQPGAKAEPVSFAPAKSPLELWAQIPTWMKVLCTGIVAIFALSVLVRMGTLRVPVARSIWATAQLAVGGGVFITFHLIAFFKASMKGNRLGWIDALVHPVEVWRPTVHDLPRTARTVWLAAWGFTAALSAVAVIGGIRYSALVDDWGFRQRAATDVAAAIKAKITEEALKGAKKADSLDEAVRNAAANAMKGNDGKHELELLSTDCVVVGYNVNQADGKLSDLILASVVDGQLKYVGTVTEGIPPGISKDLLRRLTGLKRETALVKCSATGTWVRPVVSCRASFKSWTDDKRMTGPVFKELLADVSGGN